MGAAVDNEEVSKNLADVFDSNYDDTKFAFGGSIERTVSKFYNLVNSEDDILESGGFTYDCILIMVVELCSHTALYPNSLSFDLTHACYLMMFQTGYTKTLLSSSLLSYFEIS